jgi:hypothetical protein
MQYAPSLPRDVKTAALAIRLQRYASFQEKLDQLVGKCPTKKAPGIGRLLNHFRSKF